jgi:hypothetical protein
LELGGEFTVFDIASGWICGGEVLSRKLGGSGE